MGEIFYILHKHENKLEEKFELQKNTRIKSCMKINQYKLTLLLQQSLCLSTVRSNYKHRCN